MQLALGPGESEPQTAQKTMAQLQIGDKVQVRSRSTTADPIHQPFRSGPHDVSQHSCAALAAYLTDANLLRSAQLMMEYPVVPEMIFLRIAATSCHRGVNQPTSLLWSRLNFPGCAACRL